VGAVALALASCGTGEQLAAGPTFGYLRERGWSVGWEAGGGPMSTLTSGDPSPTTASLFTHFNVGMSWRPGAATADARERITYLAWEPWLLLGGTFGVTHSSTNGSLHPLLGWWEAAPYVLGAGRRQFPLYDCSPCYTVSLAFGWRWDGAGEFYLSPKFGILNDMKMPWPFQTWPD